MKYVPNTDVQTNGFADNYIKSRYRLYREKEEL